MRNFIQKKYQREIESGSMLEASKILEKYDNVINFSIGDPDLPTPDIVLKETSKDLFNGYTHYTHPLGMIELRQEIQKEFFEEFNTKVEIPEIIVTTSASHGLFLACSALIDPGDECIVFDPYFTSYAQVIFHCGGKLISVPTFEEEKFAVNEERLRKAITNKTKIIIVNTPCNPTGACFDEKTLKMIASVAIENDLIVIADDIYTIYTYQQPFQTMLTIKEMKDRLVVLRSLSKDYCMSGFRIGYAIAPIDIIDAMNRVNESCIYSAPSISQRAALHALRHRHEFQTQIRNTFYERAKYVYERIKKIPYLSVLEPSGSIYLFINIKKTKLTSKEFCDTFLKRYQLLFLAGSIFGKYGEGYVRMALIVPIPILKEAFDRLEKDPFI